MRRELCTKIGVLSAFALAIAAYAQPANDLCSNAQNVGLGSTAIDNTGAGTEGPGATCGFGGATGQSDIFFRFTAPSTTTYAVETCGSFAPFDDSIIQVMSDCAGTSVLGCNDDFCGLLSRVTFSATAGTPYIIRVSGWAAGDVGPGTLTITEPPPAPPGDLCTNASPVSVGSTSFDTTGANNDDVTDCGGSGPDIFYSFMSPAGGCFTIDTFGSSFDTILAVLENDCFTEIVCNDDTGGLQSELRFVASPGVTYIIQIDGFGGAFGTGTLNITGPNPGPANDLCANATVVTVGSTAFDNNCAGTDGAGSCGFGGDPGSNDIWYRFTAPSTDTYRIDTCQSLGLDTQLQVYDTCGGTEIACNDDACGLSSSVSFSATSGTTYVIRIAGWGGTQGAGIMTIGVPGPGETCPTTLVATLGSTPFDTSSFAGDATTNCGGSGPDMFFNFTPTASGTYIFDTFGSSFDTVLALLASNCTTQITCNDDAGGTLQSQMAANLTAGTTYVVQVDGFGGSFGSGTLNITQSSSSNPYNICSSTSAFENISSTGTASTAGNCDDCFEFIPVGFTFTFFGNAYSDVFISSNGLLSFGAGSATFGNAPIPSPSAPNNMICPLWDDFNPGVQGDVYYQTLGTAPNRRLIVQWDNCIQFGASSGSNTFQAVLFEGSNNIEFRYGTIDAQIPADSTVGVENDTGLAGASYDNALLGTGNTALLVKTGACGPTCDDIDFNNDGLFPDTQDVDDFISVFQGGPCSTGNCNDIDFNNDNLFPDTLDLQALLSVFQGGPCF